MFAQTVTSWLLMPDGPPGVPPHEVQPAEVHGCPEERLRQPVEQLMVLGFTTDVVMFCVLLPVLVSVQPEGTVTADAMLNPVPSVVGVVLNVRVA